MWKFKALHVAVLAREKKKQKMRSFRIEIIAEDHRKGSEGNHIASVRTSVIMTFSIMCTMANELLIYFFCVCLCVSSGVIQKEGIGIGLTGPGPPTILSILN